MSKQKPFEVYNDVGEIDFLCCEAPKCPHCGYIIDDLSDYPRLFDDGEHDVDCPNCGLEYGVSTNIKISFTTLGQ